MNTERTIKLIYAQFSTDILKLEDELELVLNGDGEASLKSIKAREILKQMVLTEQALVKFQTMMTNNNNTQNKEENG
jgi:hypothetical protein